MLSLASLVGGNTADPLRDASAADAFWRMLPRNDPIDAQKAVSGALSDLTAEGKQSVGRLRAVLALDQRARKLVEALLINYFAGQPKPSSLEKNYWQSAFELCVSFAEAHSHFLRSMRDGLRSQGWREYLPSVVMRLFQHRQIELLLRPFVDERSTRFSWTELHEAYRFAHSRGVLHQPLPISRIHSQREVESTLEREYVHVLLQDLMNGGQFPPHDAFWANQSIPRWGKAVALESRRVNGTERRFVVDLNGDAGLARSSPESPETCLELDTTPILASIRDEITSLRDALGRTSEGSSMGRGRQLKLLRKLSVIYAPDRPVVARRGERKPVALQVEVVAGLAHIVRAVRNKPKRTVAAAVPAVPEVEEITITVFGGFTEGATDGFGGASTIMQRPAGAGDATYPSLQLVDRSDSGCRLHGPAPGAMRVTPGALIAFREGAAAPWTLAIVRRVARLAGKEIDIGVEYVGNDPRGVMVTVASVSDAGSAAPPAGERARFAALYLRESATHPVLPIKTLVLPARRFAPEERLTLRSAGAVYTIQLKEPLEEQGDFLWAPFEIVDHKVAQKPAAVNATSGMS